MDKKEIKYLSILEHHKGILYKVAKLYSYAKQDQDDLIQEIALQIWQSMDRYNDQYKWSTWIYRIALNTSISFLRKNRMRKVNTVALDAIIEHPQLATEIEQDDQLILLRKFIKELKEIDKALILLHLEGLTSQEISDIMDITQTNVTTKIFRIKKLLQSKFKTQKRL